MIDGEWVTFLGNPLKNYGSTDKIVQRAVDFQLTSGISGEKFYGTISGHQITLDLNGKMTGTVSSNGNVMRFSDMAMVRLGSPTCGTTATCQLP